MNRKKKQQKIKWLLWKEVILVAIWTEPEAADNSNQERKEEKRTKNVLELFICFA